MIQPATKGGDHLGSGVGDVHDAQVAGAILGVGQHPRNQRQIDSGTPRSRDPMMTAAMIAINSLWANAGMTMASAATAEAPMTNGLTFAGPIRERADGKHRHQQGQHVKDEDAGDRLRRLLGTFPNVPREVEQV